MKDDREKENQRILTPTEQKRKIVFEQRKEYMQAEGYVVHDLTIGLKKANVMALVLGFPIAFVLCIAFFMCNPRNAFSFGVQEVLYFVVSFIVLIVVHELIHGLTWAIFAPHHWKNIEFGLIKEYWTPYCTCSEPLKKYQYIIGAGMPTILVGIVPAIIGMFLGSYWIFLTGICMIFGGGGDLTIILELLRYRSTAKDTVYLDHPYQAGVVAFEKI